MALSVDTGPGTIIVAPDEGLTIGALARQIAAHVGFEGPVVFTGDLEGQRLKRLQSARFVERFPGFPFTSLDEGLAAAVAWYRQSHTTPEGLVNVAG